MKTIQWQLTFEVIMSNEDFAYYTNRLEKLHQAQNDAKVHEDTQAVDDFGREIEFVEHELEMAK